MWTRWMIGAVLMGIVFSCSAANSIENPNLIGLKDARDVVSGPDGAFVFNGTTSKAELLFSKTDDITYCVWVRANSSGSVIGRMGYNNALSIQNSQIVFNIFDVNGKWNGTGVACPAGPGVDFYCGQLEQFGKGNENLYRRGFENDKKIPFPLAEIRRKNLHRRFPEREEIRIQGGNQRNLLF